MNVGRLMTRGFQASVFGVQPCFAGAPTLDDPLISTSLAVLKCQTDVYKSVNSGQETLIFGDTAIWGKQHPGAAHHGQHSGRLPACRLPSAARGGCGGNYHLMGKRATNEANTDWTESVSAFDFGAPRTYNFSLLFPFH